MGVVSGVWRVERERRERSFSFKFEKMMKN